MATKYIKGEKISSLFIGVLVKPQKIRIGCKKYKFNKTKVLSFTSSLKIFLKIKPTIIRI